MLIILVPANGITASQKDDPHEHPPKLLNYSKMTTRQLVGEAEKIIFGGLGRAKVQGAVGRGQCPLCHATLEGMLGERAPNLFGASKRASERLKDPRYQIGKPQDRDTVQKEAFPGSGTATTPLEYIAETFMCSSCYVVAGYGVLGTNDKESPDFAVTKPPVSLKIDDLVAVITWLYVHDSQQPPSPSTIVKALKKFMTSADWKRVTTLEPQPRKAPPDIKVRTGLYAYGDEPLEEIFEKAQCVVCHTIPGILNANGTIGPRLTMKSLAPLRLSDPGYEGAATSIREYVIESILFPGLYIPTGYPDDIHPRVYGEKLSAKALYRIVEHLSQLEENETLLPNAPR